MMKSKEKECRYLNRDELIKFVMKYYSSDDCLAISYKSRTVAIMQLMEWLLSDDRTAMPGKNLQEKFSFYIQCLLMNKDETLENPLNIDPKFGYEGVLKSIYGELLAIIFSSYGV